ncbi:LuxR C-terminal-related transcriptional regulator [Streptomyces tendae]|uniref:LuxR C-terminal-related transcriptional regulator n=1 Tax=Streptomyces tendae TaxID=1932 RepID=UPI003718B2E7
MVNGMAAVQRFPWLAPLRLALAGSGSALVLVEGVAGMGKTHVLSELSALPEAAEAHRTLWRCGVAQELPDTGRRPVLLLVDDVHRATPQETQWLRQVAENPRPGLAAILAHRPEELDTAGLPLGIPAVSYPPGLSVFRHRLHGWDTEHVRRAAAEALGDRATDEAVERLYVRSGGVPQVVVDLLDVLRAGTHPTCTAFDVDAAGVPVRLAELTLSRLDRLGAEDRPVAWAAAVLDESASRDELLAVAGMGEARGRDALLAALTAAVLSETAEGRYGFAVPLAAEAVRERVPGPIRQDLHERAGKALARRQPVSWAEVARHRRAAGLGKRWLRAVEKAACAAAESSRHQEAIRLLEQALAVPEVAPDDRARLAPLLARSAVIGLRSDETVAALTQVVRDARLPPEVRGELRLDLGLMLCNQVGEFAAGARELEAAAEELSDVCPALASRAMAALGMAEWPCGTLESHRNWLRKAARIAQDHGNDVARAAVAANQASLAVACGDPEARELVTALPADSPLPGCREHAARGLCNAADAAIWRGEYAWGKDLLSAGLDLSARSGVTYAEQTAQATGLLLDWWTGQWSGLAERCERFVAATADMPLVAADGNMVRGLLAFSQGHWGPAVRWLTASGAPSLERTRMPLAVATSGAVIRLALARENLPAAADRARAAWSAVADKGVWVWAAELAPWAVEALTRSGDMAAARTVVAEFARGLEGMDASAGQAAVMWSRAGLEEAEGRLTEAVRSYRRAAAAYRQLPRPYAWALTMEGAARCSLANGEQRPDAAGEGMREPEAAGDALRERTAGAAGADTGRFDAIASLQRCVHEYGELGASYDAARARAMLRSHQPAQARRPGRPAQTGQLSAREGQVAELAGGGLTNREIATALHLSPRTVEQHVARAIRKMGVLSRHDLAQACPPGAE